MATSRSTPILTQPSSYHPPPLPARPKISYGNRDRFSPSLADEESSPMGTVGFELTIFGLDHQNPDSARDHLVHVLNDLCNQHTFPPVNVWRGDAISALDYAFISLSSSVSSPCPDLLEDLRLLLNTLPDLRATWRLCNGPDCTRRVFFVFPSDGEAQSMLNPLCEWFQAQCMSIMAERTTHPPSTSQTCLSFDLFNGDDVAIGGIASLGNVESSLNSHLRQQYGHDVIVGSRVELEDDVYCAVLRDWPSTQAFLHNNQNGLPTDWFLYGVSVGKPTLLFSFNTQGAPPNPVSRPMPFSTSENVIQPQLDYFRSEFGQFTSTLNTMFDHISQAEQHLEQNNQTLLGMMSAQYLLSNYRMNLLLLTNEQDRLNAQCDCYQDQLAATSDLPTRQCLQAALGCANDCRSIVAAEIEQDCKETQAVRLSLAAHDCLALPISPSPVLSPPLVSTSDALPSSTPPSHPSRIRSCSPDDMGESRGMPRPRLQSVSDSRWAPLGSGPVTHKGKQHASDDMVETSVASSVPFSALSINSNGLGDPLKCHSISNMISHFHPTIWLISETKSPRPMASHVHTPSYHVFENPGLSTPSHGGKWGVVLGVSSTVYSQQVSLESYPALQARVLVVDLVMPAPSGRGVQLVYMPPGILGYNPFSGSNYLLAITMRALTSLSATIAVTPSLIGRFIPLSTSALPTFLWLMTLLELPTIALYFSTFRFSMIQHCYDQAVASHLLLPTLVLKCPPASGVPSNMKRYRLSDFAQQVDNLLQGSHHPLDPISNDEEFDSRYRAMTETLGKAAAASFQLLSALPPGVQEQHVNNDKI
ncbi:hypothetical protein EDC04DRAFT_2912820 [Pisolithus marmoratus]|nr:hypothetical protein EDC04DRAFT_2912820 [Pisolithus marmoratus]